MTAKNEAKPHIRAYRDVKPEINVALEKVDFLLDYQKTYFCAQEKLRSAMRRIGNEALIERMKTAGNEAALRELERATRYKDTIEKLISDIDVFESESKKLLDAIIKNGKIDGEELAVIYPYLFTLAEDNCSHGRIPKGLADFFCEDTEEKCSLLSKEERALLYCLIIKIKAKGRYYFAYPHIADALFEYACSYESLPRKSRVGFCVSAGEYYVSACLRKKAMECYKAAASIAMEGGYAEDSAYALQNYYRINATFPKEMQARADTEKIKKEYGKYAGIVLKGTEEPFIKVDPIEFSEGFAECFRAVMYKVEAEIDKTGEPKTVYGRWSLMEKYFAEMNVAWRSPKAMNPTVMFD